MIVRELAASYHSNRAALPAAQGFRSYGSLLGFAVTSFVDGQPQKSFFASGTRWRNAS